MKIAAFSDLHGISELPKIEEGTDIVCIAGDIIPLRNQTKILESHEWFMNTFLQWVNDLDVKKVFLVPGNHDFMFERYNYDSIKKDITDAQLGDKLKVLIDEEYIFKDIKIYGCPWVDGLNGWAFSNAGPKNYNKIPDDCDILISHMPSVVGKVGISNPNTNNERQFGSQMLENVLLERQVKINICGHVHTGTHGGVELNTKSGTTTKIYNVSMVNEQYIDEFPVTYIEYE